MVTIEQLLNARARADYGPTFGGLDPADSDFTRARIAVLPVPYDRTSTYNKGADRGPAAMLAASSQVELYDIETDSEVYRNGIATLAPLVVDAPPEELFAAVQQATTAILSAEKFPVVLGGEHSITPGVVAALAAKYADLTVLQLDAHGDTRDSYHGSKYNHACAMARVHDYCRSVQVGIRAIDSSETKNLDRERVFFGHQVANPADLSWQPRVSSLLSPHVYVTIDLDCFDSSIMPSTGTPEPGGLNWYQVTSLLRLISRNHTVVGFDVVELLPRAEDPAPDFLAAKLVYQFLSYVFAAR